MDMTIYAFYNNKGGVGKTTLCQHAASLYAEKHPSKHVLVIDMCPQANVSQFLLGGGPSGYNTNQSLQTQSSRKNVVGFVEWLLRGNAGFTTPNTSYSVQPSKYNPHIPDNLYLIAGDNFLESLSLALNYAVINPANLQAWQEYMTAIRRLSEHESANVTGYKSTTVFIDCNPSFSVYTQMALLSSDYLLVPMMADYTSIEGIKGIFSMLYGKYPSAATQKYAQNIVTFSKQVAQFQMSAPVIYEFIFNNFTSMSGIATAYGSLKDELTDFCYQQYQQSPGLFAVPSVVPKTVDEWRKEFVSDVKDFHTAGKVSAALGIPLHKLPAEHSYLMPDGTKIEVPAGNYPKAVENIRAFVAALR